MNTTIVDYVIEYYYDIPRNYEYYTQGDDCLCDYLLQQELSITIYDTCYDRHVKTYIYYNIIDIIAKHLDACGDSYNYDELQDYIIHKISFEFEKYGNKYCK